MLWCEDNCAFGTVIFPWSAAPILAAVPSSHGACPFQESGTRSLSIFLLSSLSIRVIKRAVPTWEWHPLTSKGSRQLGVSLSPRHESQEGTCLAGKFQCNWDATKRQIRVPNAPEMVKGGIGRKDVPVRGPEPLVVHVVLEYSP